MLPLSVFLTYTELNSHHLSRLLFCVGHIAFLHMVHCEVAVAMEIKNKRAAADGPSGKVIAESAHLACRNSAVGPMPLL